MWILATTMKHENIVRIKICYKTKIAFEISFYPIIYKFMSEIQHFRLHRHPSSVHITLRYKRRSSSLVSLTSLPTVANKSSAQINNNQHQCTGSNQRRAKTHRIEPTPQNSNQNRHKDPPLNKPSKQNQLPYVVRVRSVAARSTVKPKFEEPITRQHCRRFR